MSDVEPTVLHALATHAAYGSHSQETKPLEVAYRLLCVVGANLGTSYRLGKEPAVIGRGPVEIRLQATDVSRSHARVALEGDQLVIEDLASVNGTAVNGVRIKRSTAIHLGDRIQVGSTILVVTQHDELEARVQQLQRLEAMAAAVSGLAHDFNNALQVIECGLTELAQDLPPGDYPALTDVKRAAESATNLARRIMNLGRGGALPTAVVDVVELISGAVAMARHTMGDRITITTSGLREAAIRASRDELQQVLLNLCLNARDAMPGGGALLIDTRHATLDRMSAASSNLAEGDYVEIVVADTGTGMDEATLARAFEPFFTTKGPGKGTGLGLAMTHAIVRRHGGAVRVESTLGRGTTFRILLPRAAA